ncbi:MAG: Flp pilus assembly protein CpaB [Pirellulales bacterium]|nr:Flp pilus assembly protein CpaB [Pirellulales bacterium]
MSRISTETMTFGILALLFGLGGAYLARLYLRPEPEVEAAAPPPAIDVPLAAMDLPTDKLLRMGDIVIKPMTTAQIADQNIDPDRTLLNPQQIIGRRLSRPVRMLQPFLTDSLMPEGTRPPLTANLKPGLRAVTVPLSGLDAVGGFAGPGSMVDVFFRTKSIFDERPGRVSFPDMTKLLLENVQVLALGPYTTPGEMIEEDAADINTVTFAVTPDQAARLAIVEGRGDLSLVLRDPNETSAPGGAGRQPTVSTFMDVLGWEQPPGPWITEVYTRGSGSARQFPRDDIAPPREESFSSSADEPIGAPIVPPGRTTQPSSGSGAR